MTTLSKSGFSSGFGEASPVPKPRVFKKTASPVGDDRENPQSTPDPEPVTDPEVKDKDHEGRIDAQETKVPQPQGPKEIKQATPDPDPAPAPVPIDKNPAGRNDC